MDGRKLVGARPLPERKARRWVTALGAVATLLLLAAACGGERQPPGTTPASPTSVSPTHTPDGPPPATPAPTRESPSFDFAAPPRFLLPDDHIEGARQRATPEQLLMLEDGIITYAEYEQAAYDHIACLEGNGFTETSVEVQYGGKQLFVHWAFKNPDPQALRTAWEPCLYEWLLIASLWDYQVQSTQQEIQEGRSAFIACLQENNAPLLPDNPTYEDLERVMTIVAGTSAQRSYVACQAQIQQEFGLWDFQY